MNVLEMWTGRISRLKDLPNVHVSSEWQSWNLNPGSCGPGLHSHLFYSTGQSNSEVTTGQAGYVWSRLLVNDTSKHPFHWHLGQKIPRLFQKGGFDISKCCDCKLLSVDSRVLGQVLWFAFESPPYAVCVWVCGPLPVALLWKVVGRLEGWVSLEVGAISWFQLPSVPAIFASLPWWTTPLNHEPKPVFPPGCFSWVFCQRNT